MFIQSFCPCVIGLFVVLLSYFLYILNFNILSSSSLSLTLSVYLSISISVVHSFPFNLFILLRVSFALQNIFSLMHAMFIFHFLASALDTIFKKNPTMIHVKHHFLQYFILRFLWFSVFYLSLQINFNQFL